MVINVTDNAFDNLPKHRPQRGHFILLGDQKINDDYSNKYKVHCIGWPSSKIQRVVRSTLSAEAYSCADSVDMLIWMRATLDEILYSEMDVTDIVHDTCPVKCISVTGCKNLHDTITKEKISLTDRIPSLAAAILRQSLKEVSIKRVKSEQ
eukprot:9492291-Pyramimonas_sp.AAC.1